MVRPLVFVAVTIILATGLSSERQANASTVNVTGTLDLNGQSFALASGETLNFDISGPIPVTINDGFVVRVGITGAPTVTSGSIIINNAPFIGAQVFATVNGAFASADTNNCSNCGVTHPIEGNFFSITDSQRLLSVLSSINVSELNIANLPMDAIVSINYTVGIDLPSGLTANAATPLPAALWLFGTGLGALGLGAWRRKRKGAALSAMPAC